MLRSSFIHWPGVGEKTERRLWDAGFGQWQDFLDSASISECRSPVRNAWVESAQRSIDAFESDDLAYFAGSLPRREWWRMYGDYRDSFAFVDIETTGLSKVYDKLTVIGIYANNEFEEYVAGDNLDEGLARLSSLPLVATFNGSLFDLPFVREKYPMFREPLVHLDLRFIMRRLGFGGPLKAIERDVGIARDRAVAGIDGYGATVLWSRYTRGDIEALATLVRYNLEDTANLKRLMDFAYERLVALGPQSGASFEAVEEPRLELRNDSVVVNGVSIQLKPPPQKKFPVTLNDLLREAECEGRGTRVVGIDLTGSEKRPTGWALLDGQTATTARIATDADIIRLTLDAGADVVSIDSPLSLPVGREGVWIEAPGVPISRACERYLKRIGVSVFWCLLPSMRSLTERGMRLAERFREEGLTVIESFPGAAQDILQIPRKGASRAELAEGLASFGIAGSFVESPVSHDELDAITCALVASFFQADRYEALGNSLEDYLIVPNINPGVKIVDCV